MSEKIKIYLFTTFILLFNTFSLKSQLSFWSVESSDNYTFDPDPDQTENDEYHFNPIPFQNNNLSSTPFSNSNEDNTNKLLAPPPGGDDPLGIPIGDAIPELLAFTIIYGCFISYKKQRKKYDY